MKSKKTYAIVIAALLLVVDLSYVLLSIQAQNFFSMLLLLVLIPCVLFAVATSGVSSMLFQQAKRVFVAAVSGALFGVLLSFLTSYIMKGHNLASLSANTQRIAGANENLDISNISVNIGFGSILMIGFFTFILIYLMDRFVFKNKEVEHAF
ncbi:hypothetical protein [Enterococcus termitis]|uniref:Uncharacterized protein n=1 Tax=Enterococcus termitis TaxID=332950 RepID=A0A1E5GCT8_9ENTE|nr:hypothetical protein [Enterococcus termitis]OEG10518.1 hypothetical protein BCR25_08565 [Enterococcus termitis]